MNLIKSLKFKLTKRRVLREAFNTHWFARNHINNGSISRFKGFGVVLQLLARAAINLFLEFCKLASDVSCVTVQHWSIASTDLARVIKDDHLQSKDTAWTSDQCILSSLLQTFTPKAGLFSCSVITADQIYLKWVLD